MNRRVEQRFQVYTPVKLTFLDEQEQPELDCLLIDISGAGMKLVADVALPLDQMISIEAGQQVVLAEVRHCSPRGGKFAIGVEKVHVMPAAILDQHTSKAARLQALVDNYHSRINEGIEATLWEADVLGGMTPEAVPQSPEVVVGGPIETTLGQPSPETGGPPPQPVSAVCSPVEPAENSFDPIRAALETMWEVPPVRSRLTAKVIGAVVGSILLAALLIAPFKGRLSSFPNHAVAVEKKAPEPVLAQSVVEPVRSTSQESAPSAASVPVHPAPVHPVVTGVALGKGHASLKFTGASWASVCADGQKLLERLLPAGEVREITFSDMAVVRLGNAGAVEITLNGKPLGSLGQPGQLRLMELTSTGLRPLPVGDPADDCGKARVN